VSVGVDGSANGAGIVESGAAAERARAVGTAGGVGFGPALGWRQVLDLPALSLGFGFREGEEQVVGVQAAVGDVRGEDLADGVESLTRRCSPSLG
jgi:hypothetical protein